MTSQRLLRLLFTITVAALIQSCKLERIDPQCPTLTRLNPAGAGMNEVVEIKGSGFKSRAPHLYKIFIGDKTVDVLDVPDSNTLRFKVPPGLGSGAVSVRLHSGVSCGSNQNIYFTYYYTATRVGTLSSAFSKPAGLDVDNDGHLVVADPGNYLVKVLDTSTGALIKTYGKGGPGTTCDLDSLKTSDAHFFATDIDVDSRGNIFIAESSRSMIRWIDPRSPDSVRTYVGKCSSPGSRTDIVHRLSARINRPYSVFRDELGGALYFTDALGVRKIFNSFVYFPMGGNLGIENGIEVNRSRIGMGPIFVSAHTCASLSCPPSIISFNEPVADRDTIKGQFQKPVAFTLDSIGNIFMVDREVHKISVLYTDGVLRVLAGSVNGYNEQEAEKGSDAKFSYPSGIAIAVKNKVVTSVYISDTENNKVRKIKIQ